MHISRRLEQHIYELESALLQPEVRQSAKAVSALLAEGFVEFGSSGRVYNYTPGDTFDAGASYVMEDFKAQRLARGCIVATYRAAKKDEAGNIVSKTLRSSLWKRVGGAWRMAFHQGTIIP